jgi:hypothetical protein
MTVTASPADVPGVYGQGVGNGQSLLNAIAAIQTTLNTISATATQQRLALGVTRAALQVQAVDYFMGSYWVSADQILATFSTSLTVQACGRYYGYVQSQLTAIAARLAQINQTNPTQYSHVITMGNQEPQYSRYSPPYPLTPPDTYWYALQTQLVDFLMATGIVPASLILSTMTGVQTYPYTYNTNGQYFSDATEGDSGADL